MCLEVGLVGNGLSLSTLSMLAMLAGNFGEPITTVDVDQREELYKKRGYTNEYVMMVSGTGVFRDAMVFDVSTMAVNHSSNKHVVYWYIYGSNL